MSYLPFLQDFMDTVSSGLYRHHCYSSLMKINQASFSHTINNCLEGVNLMGILPWSDSDVFKALNKAQGGLSYPQVPPPLNLYLFSLMSLKLALVICITENRNFQGNRREAGTGDSRFPSV